jgi:hypothetical protein
MRNSTIAVVLGAIACGPTVVVEQDMNAGTTTGPEVTTSGASSTAMGDASTSTTTDWDDGSSDTSADGSTSTGDADPWPPGFIGDPDGGPGSIECDIWAQNCPPGEKCMPWADDGGVSWNATRCSPLAPDPAQTGESCTVEGSGVSGIDTCDAASMCWNVDPETNEGTCIAFCVGTENNPICTEPGHVCSVHNDGVLILCVPKCDPIAQDCPDGDACYPVDQAFVCMPDCCGEMGAYGDPCEFANAPPSAVPDCSSDVGCCTTFCHLNEENWCPGAGQECLPWFEPGQAPFGYEHVGLCAVPE